MTKHSTAHSRVYSETVGTNIQEAEEKIAFCLPPCTSLLLPKTHVKQVTLSELNLKKKSQTQMGRVGANINNVAGDSLAVQ